MKWGNIFNCYLDCYINYCILYNEKANEKLKKKNQTELWQQWKLVKTDFSDAVNLDKISKLILLQWLYSTATIQIVAGSMEQFT